ncbi:response regulator [Streptomyces hawaiiensis]|uniref:Response regulatory domain-containing protein n=1 Tax=Streptomyces hawaiiensis TaxID=67305 RepID=A0A6G5RDR9_9ACTN|nr:response regulator [Streptomyces hawaiiensis]QCD55961.1 hypothetical protein CEB94_14595 [Streptomyces hawaiiensis]
MTLADPNPIDVLVVDDHAQAAADYAQLIRSATGISVTHTSDPGRALEICRTNPVKVVVLDQRMPNRSGTDLFQDICAMDPKVHAIMLTGEAGAEEVGTALSLGYKGYVPKNQISNLPQKVLHEYIAWQLNVASAALTTDRPAVLQRRSGWLRRRPTVTYRILRAQLLDESHTFDDGWRDLVTLHAGQTETRQVKVEASHTIVLERETVDKLTGGLGLASKQVASLTAKLNVELSNRFKESDTSSTLISESVERTFQLPAEPTDTNEVHIRVRRIMGAPVYARVRVDIVSDCQCCGSTNVLVLQAFVPSKRTALRQVDRLSNGEVRQYDLGDFS